MSTLAQHWDDLVTVALLGTDRRDPPAPPPGPVGDAVADCSAGRDPSPAEGMRLQVAAAAVARRAGMRPGPVLAGIAPAPDDPRPTTSPDLARLWWRMIIDWPLLDDEVQLTIPASGRRTAPDLLVAALARSRGDAARHARVVLAGGPLAPWLLALQPHLRARAAKRPSDAEIATLPALALPADLLAMATDAPVAFAEHLRTEFDAGRFGVPHRALLVNLLARVPPAALLPAAQQLGRVAPSRSTIGLALALADLAQVRHHLLAHLQATTEPITP